MKKLFFMIFTVFFVNVAFAGRCLEPIRPLLPLKPISCWGTWTQILECDSSCNCAWRPVCIE